MNSLIERVFNELAFFLNIQVPRIIFEQPDPNKPMCQWSDDEACIILRCDSPKRKLAYEMACAMRRFYQYRHNSMILLAYHYRNEVDDEVFFCQPSEVDVHAFAYCYCLARFSVEIIPEYLPKEAVKLIMFEARSIFDNNLYCFSDIIRAKQTYKENSHELYYKQLVRFKKKHRRRYKCYNSDGSLRSPYDETMPAKIEHSYKEGFFNEIESMYLQAVETGETAEAPTFDSYEEACEYYSEQIKEAYALFDNEPKNYARVRQMLRDIKKQIAIYKELL